MPTSDKIVGVALQLKDGTIVSLPLPNHHSDLIRSVTASGRVNYYISTSMQGFVLQNGDFVSRTQAYAIALANRQLKQPKHSKTLYSEDLTP